MDCANRKIAVNFQTIITPACLADNLYDPNWLLLDCRGSLTSNHNSYKLYTQSHIPNAYYCCLGGMSSNTITNTCDDSSFEYEQLIEILVENGYSKNTQIVLYEDENSSFTDTIWLKLRSVGIQNVAVLEGGYTLWKELNLPTTLSSNEPVKRDLFNSG